MNPIEEKFIRNFISKSKQERFLYKFSREEHRKQALCEMYNPDVFDQNYLKELDFKPTPDRVLVELKRRGVSQNQTCYVLSHLQHMDGNQIPLTQSLIECVGRSILSIIICLDGKVAYVENDYSTGYILMHR